MATAREKYEKVLCYWLQAYFSIHTLNIFLFRHISSALLNIILNLSVYFGVELLNDIAKK